IFGRRDSEPKGQAGAPDRAAAGGTVAAAGGLGLSEPASQCGADRCSASGGAGAGGTAAGAVRSLQRPADAPEAPAGCGRTGCAVRIARCRSGSDRATDRGKLTMASITETGAPIALDGTRKSRGNLTKARIRWVVLGLVVVFAVIGLRLVQLGSIVTEST